MLVENLGPLKKKTILKAPPPVPETGWKAPREFPNLASAAVIGFDVERKEYDWDHGPGWAKGKAHTIGFSVGARARDGTRGKWYFPIRHEVEPRDNLNPDQCLSWLKTVLETEITKVGANLIYDVGSLTDDNIYVRGPLYDCQFAESVLYSDQEVNLDHLGQIYLGAGKESSELYEWCARAYGGKPTGNQRDNLWRAPPRLVGPYGEFDAMGPIDILDRQLPELDRLNLTHVFRLECGLIRLLVQMRIAGIRVDLEAAEALDKRLTDEINRTYSKILKETGISIDSVNSNEDVARLFDKAGVHYPKTELGNPSFRKDWLKNLDHPIADLVNECREYEKLQGTFIRSYILEGNIKGRIHASFHPMRDGENGAKTGRFASSDPNLQNIPIRTEIAKLVRRIFIADEGHIHIEKNDYNQIEYRYLSHYAVDEGDGSAERLRNEYRTNPKTDYHAATKKNVKTLTGIEIERRPIKNMNFGLIYGMSQKKLIRQNGFTPAQGAKVFTAYHKGNPYVRPTMRATAAEMQQCGYITTVLGRRILFNEWEPMFTDFGQPRAQPLPFELAIKYYGAQIKRAHEHKAINYRLQGSAADHIKEGMRQCFEAGVFDYTGIPRLQVHDELVFSVPDDDKVTQEAYKEMRRILETAIKLSIPVIVDYKRGPSWGECET